MGQDLGEESGTLYRDSVLILEWKMKADSVCILWLMAWLSGDSARLFIRVMFQAHYQVPIVLLGKGKEWQRNMLLRLVELICLIKCFFFFFNWISLVPYFIYRCCGTILWKCKVPPAGRCACFCSSTKSQWLVCIEQWNGGSWVVITSWQKTKCKM